MGKAKIDNMILKKDSILYYLPKDFAVKDLLIVDSIRFTTESIDYNYHELKREIKKITTNFGKFHDVKKKNLIPLFTSCWNIIDNVHRFQSLYKLLASDNEHETIKVLASISDLRNTFQHMDERIEECLFNYEMPFYGQISWEVNLGEDNLMHKFFAVSGLFIPRGKNEFKVLKINRPKNHIKEIMLSTFIRVGSRKNNSFKKTEININNLIREIKKIINKFEKNIEYQLITHNIQRTDWIKLRDILVNIKY